VLDRRGGLRAALGCLAAKLLGWWLLRVDPAHGSF
jgi:hypothetical protein